MSKEVALGLFHVRQQKKGAEPTEQVNLRMPESLERYAAKEGTAAGIDRTAVVLSAVQLRRDLSEALVPLKQRIARFSIEENLDWPLQEVEVIRRLVERGLKDAERSQRR